MQFLDYNKKYNYHSIIINESKSTTGFKIGSFRKCKE